MLGTKIAYKQTENHLMMMENRIKKLNEEELKTIKKIN
jgi:hypothetical protein